MIAFMKSVGEIYRCAALFREEKLKHLEIGRFQHTYIINICRNPGISQEQLSKLIYINKSNVARQLARLEEAGFVQRKEKEGDKRTLLVYPTQKAHDLYPVIGSVLFEWNSLILENLAENEKETLCALMEKIANLSKEKTKDIL